MKERLGFDEATYARRVSVGPCFVCATVQHHPDYVHELLYDDGRTIAFLSKYPTVIGYAIVAPKAHVERWEEQSIDDHLAVQRVVHQVARALSAALPTDRIYVLSLGSRQGNAHVHWHVAPLPPGVPYDQQQFSAVMSENGIVDISDAEQSNLATELRHAVEGGD